MPRYMTPDMPEVTLLMLQRLDDFEKYILDAEAKVKEVKVKDAAPESSRVNSPRTVSKVESQQVQLGNIQGCIGALKSSIRVYRELWWKERKAGEKKTG